MHPDRKSFDVVSPFRSNRASNSALLSAGFGLAALVVLAGCGSNYRPVVTAINPVGPASQPEHYAVVISSPSPTSNGLVNLVDFSGDTIVNTTTIGVNPQYMILGSGGAYAYVINGDQTLNSFSPSTSLLSSGISVTTLPSGSNPISLFPQGNTEYVAEAGLNEIGVLNGSAQPAFQENLPTGAASSASPSTTSTLYTVGNNGASRIYSIVSSLLSGVNGFVAAIETGQNTISATLPVGVNPVYGVMEADNRRAYILNKGSNTVTVVNAQANALDTFNSPTTGLPTATIPVGTAPIWADFAPTLVELLVLNNGNPATNTPGSVSIISIPLCTSTTVSNPLCDASNPIDAVGFGTVVATVPVGLNPVMITVLADGSQAYVANQGIPGSTTSPGSISVINLTTNTVTATIPASNSTNPLDTTVHGHPSYIASIAGLPTGKVYVTATDSTDLSIIRTDTNAISTHLPLQGAGISVRVTAAQ